MTKNELRKWAKNIRKELDIKSISKVLAQKLSNTIEYKNSKNIMLFYPLEGEIDLRVLLKDKTKKFYLPKIDGENLLCCPYEEGDAVCLSCFNTCEPVTTPCKKSLMDIIVIPALAVDKHYHRLGYGGGFYDRFLEDFTGLKIVCIPSQLIVDNIFPEEHDISFDMLISA